MMFAQLRVAIIAVVLPFCVQADGLRTTVERLETQLDGRIGVAIRDSATGQVWTHRADERFPMNSTVKVLVCAAVLSAPTLDLDETRVVDARHVVGHAPVTRARRGEAMTLAQLCAAAIDQSDNGATNILFESLGGPAQVTTFLRRIGDSVTRSDRTEPDLNAYSAGDPQDTTTPAAMVETLQTVLTGDALSPEDRALLLDWMRPGSWTAALIRPAVPADWDVVDKSGAGETTRTLIAMLTPPNRAPIFVSLSISDTDANFATRNAAMADLGAAVMQMLREQ